MQRSLLIFSTAALLTVSVGLKAAPAMLMEMGVAEQVEPEKVINISIDGNSVTVTGAAGMTLEVISLTGRHVTSMKVESPAQRFDLNLPKGCYILKIGKVVRKVTVQ